MKMLSRINKISIVFGTFLFLLIGSLFEIEIPALHVLNYFALLAFALIVHYLSNQPEQYFTKPRLRFFVMYYSFFFALCYNLISYYYTDNLYIFSGDDAIVYNDESLVMAGMPFSEGVDYYLSRHEAEDLGFVIILSFLYKIVPSKILLSLFFILAGVVTANSIFNIARCFMPSKYSFLCSITYCLSSYVIWFHASGLKESALVMLITLFYSAYYDFIYDKKVVKVWMLVLMPLFILLFRPVLSIFCLVSIAFGVVLKRKLKGPQVFFLVVVAVAGVYFLDTIMSSTVKFLLGGTESMLEIKELEGMVRGGVFFTYVVNILSSMFGPLPTLVSSKIHLSFYAPGLIFKILTSIAFWFGAIHIAKVKLFQAYPMLVFILLEIVSLTYILEALELRKSLPHFPLVYIIGFIFIHRFDSRQLINLKNHLFYKKSFNVFAFVLCALIVYWNFR